MAATGTAAGTAVGREQSDSVEEAGLARAAAGGDGAAFAALYDRYESRIFNLCNRLLGSREDAADATQEAFLTALVGLPRLESLELNFSACLFTAARNASYDTIGKQTRSEPTDELPKPSAARDPGDLYADPERAAMLTSLQDDVREANGRLAQRQREVLALRELVELSYDEIAGLMDLHRNSVAQLISRARIKLRDELRGTGLAAVAAASPECERALPLIAARQDGQLHDAGDRTWLTEHLGACDTCRVAQEATEEAGISYRAWLPILPAAWLWLATMASAAELVGADWSDIAREPAPQTGGHDAGLAGYDAAPGANGAAGVGDSGATGGGEAATATLPAVQEARVEPDGETASRRRRLLGGALLALFLLLGFSAAVAIGTDGAPQRLFGTAGTLSFSPPAASSASAPTPTGAVKKHAKKKKPTTSANAGPFTVSTSSRTTTTNQRSNNNTTPRHHSRKKPLGDNSVGAGQENGSGSTPTTGTPSKPSAPSTPSAPSARGTPGGGGSPPSGGGGGSGGTPPTTPCISITACQPR
jgi:RNA polymerase sigma factor (sigma-70 family)